jgi:hypothetical protein
MKTFVSLSLAAALIAAAPMQLLAQPGSPDGLTYKTGYSHMMKLGKDLHYWLKPHGKELISPQPISIETDVTPFVRLLFYPDEPKPIRGVWISAGFIDLVNNVAHAKAIDSLVQKGYFNEYIKILLSETGEKSLRPLPNDTNPKFWSEDILNDQQSNFNSIVGMIVAIKLAHHYLGHYEKYKDRLEDSEGRPIPINSMLTEKEWDEAFVAGVKNALDSGCMIEGIIPFFEAFDRMKVRPAWSAYFLPSFAKVPKMKKHMEKAQAKFFAGED